MHALDSSGLFASNTVPTQNASWNGGFAELDYNPTWLQQGRWLFVYRYDLIRNVHQGSTVLPNDFNNVNSHTALIRYNFNITTRADTALHLEYNNFRDKKVGVNGDDLIGNTVLVGFDFAF
jgi:hypothetical protein